MGEIVPSDMRVAMWHGNDDVRIEILPVPESTSADSLVRVSLAGICATDREIIQGHIPGVLPGVVPGHEITGIVVGGSGGKNASVGDRVIVDTFLPCQHCIQCQEGDVQKCADPGEIGFTANGGWAEFVLVPNDRLHRIPDRISDAEAVIAEPFAMTLGALLDSAEDISGSHVLIVGSGMAAAGFASAALALGASRVQVCLKSLDRAETFQKIDPRVEVITAADIQPGAADISVDSIGSQLSIESAIHGVRRKGLVICYGLAQQAVDNFPLGDVVLRNIRLSGHTNPENIWPTLIALLSDGSLSTKGLVDSFISLEDVPEKIRHKDRALRTVIDLRPGGRS